MKAEEYWNMFMETGAPEMYLLYSSARRMENGNVLDDQGPGDTNHSLQ
jgi:hypothetical protein